MVTNVQGKLNLIMYIFTSGDNSLRSLVPLRVADIHGGLEACPLQLSIWRWGQGAEEWREEGD